jgi:hypothetical protein
MKLCVAVLMVGALSGVAAGAQQPKGVPDMLANIASTPGTHTGQLNSVTVENYRYHEPAFYIPESVQALFAAYNSAGWKHLVEQNVGPKESAAPHKQLTDLWLHFHGAEIDDVTVLVRGPKQMSVVEISGALRPLDLVHLSGHFGIPKVDPGAVMIPAEPGK